jgi:preprotein translocase subunit Sss1
VKAIDLYAALVIIVIGLIGFVKLCIWLWSLLP